MPTRLALRVLVVPLTVGLLASVAAAQEWGVRSISSIGDIFAGGGQTHFTFDFSGGAGIPIAETELDDAVTPDFAGNGPWDRGYMHAFAGLPFTRNVIAPMKAQTLLTGNRSSVRFINELPAGAVGSSNTFVSDQFQYLGTQPTTLALTFNLEGRVVDPAGNQNANDLTRIRSQVAVFADTPQYGFLDDVPTLVAELGATLKQSGGVDAWDFSSLVIDDDTGGAKAMRSTTLQIDVTPGETFYVWQTLRTDAAYGAREADAFGTLTATFDQPSLVQRVGYVVPEPATLAYAVLLGSVLCARRTRHLRCA